MLPRSMRIPIAHFVDEIPLPAWAQMLRCLSAEMSRVSKLRFCGEVERHTDAVERLEDAGDYTLVVRGVPRGIVLRCPDNCGDVLTINLDARSGKAWRLDRRNDKLTLYPSVWRNEGCRAHFIVWRDVVFWCDGSMNNPEVDAANLKAIQKALISIGNRFVHYETLAEEASVHPWDALWGCQLLVRRGDAVVEKQVHFKTKSTVSLWKGREQ